MTTTTMTTSEAPAWRSLVTPERLIEIEQAREDVARAGGIRIQPGGTYGIVCRVCLKPNQPHTTFCTGCSFPTSPHDLQRLPDNIFLDLIQGRDIGAMVHYRDSSVIVFDDKYGVSANHLDIIPTTVYEDISVLTRGHIPMLEQLYEHGKRVLLARRLPFISGDGSDEQASFDQLVSAGYNYPVSVKHLHLHMMVPPYRHDKILQYPRWHSHAKVIADLREFGRVRLYSEHPDDVRGPLEQQRAVANSRAVEQQLQKQQQ